MLLYFGCYLKVEKPLLLKNQRALDFGRGFYTTTDKEQAIRWSKNTVKRLKSGTPIVNVYEISDEDISKMNILSFEKADEKWLDFIVDNRKNIPIELDYDIISGPVADDQTMPTIDLYLSGLYDKKITIEKLLPQKLKDQFVFKTEKSLKSLKFLEAESYE